MTTLSEALADLKAKADAARPGPWSYDMGTISGPGDDGSLGKTVCGDSMLSAYKLPDDADGGYIAACSPEVVKALVAVAEGVAATVYGGKPIDHRTNMAALADALGAKA